MKQEQKNGTRVFAAIIDYGLGNLFSVKHACGHVGMESEITSNKADIDRADLVILPGVGAFGSAMESLNKLDLVRPLVDAYESGKMFIGICLGMQLVMSVSYEFGEHRGLGIVEGSVVKFEHPEGESYRLKVPHVGWNRVFADEGSLGTEPENASTPAKWKETPLKDLPDGEFMYFVHSYYVRPESSDVVLTRSSYEGVPFCSTLKSKNLVAFQYHPERSGALGLNIYRNIYDSISQEKEAKK